MKGVAVERYREQVEACAHAVGGPSELLFNRSADHATIIVENLFASAQKEVNILTGSLDPEVYGTASAVDAAIGFLGRSPSTRIRIALEKPADLDWNSHKLLARFRECNLLDRVDIRVVPKEVSEGYIYHFAVADEQSYRLEADRDKLEAVVQFRNPVAGRSLSERFQQIWLQSAEFCECAADVNAGC